MPDSATAATEWISQLMRARRMSASHNSMRRFDRVVGHYGPRALIDYVAEMQKPSDQAVDVFGKKRPCSLQAWRRAVICTTSSKTVRFSPISKPEEVKTTRRPHRALTRGRASIDHGATDTFERRAAVDAIIGS
jgi:hypothetical protein